MLGVNSAPVGAIVLAAGNSSRMGRPKQLLSFDGQTLVRRTTQAALDAGCQPVIVVTGCQSEAVTTQLSALAVTPIFHPKWAAGMGSSLRAGIAEMAACTPRVAATVILVCDQPHLEASIIRSLACIWMVSGKSMAACQYGGSVGPPCLFARSVFSKLLTLPDGHGAKRLLLADPGNVATFPWPMGATDLDTPTDLWHFYQKDKPRIVQKPKQPDPEDSIYGLVPEEG